MVDKELVCGLESNDDHYLKLHAERGQGLSQQITALLAEHHQTLHPVQEADDIQTLLALVSANLGFTIVPASAKYIANDQVVFVPLDGENAQWDIGLIWNEAIDSPMRARFIEFMTCTKR